jgi:hypothetical protein
MSRLTFFSAIASLPFAGAVLAGASEDIAARAAAVEARVIETRRDIHANPELGFEEKRTAALVAKRLRGLGIAVRERVGKTGVVGVLRGGKPGRRRPDCRSRRGCAAPTTARRSV